MIGRLKRLTERRARLQLTIEGQREDLASAATLLKSRFIGPAAAGSAGGVAGRGPNAWSGSLLDPVIAKVLEAAVFGFLRRPAFVFLGVAGLITIGAARRRFLGHALAGAGAFVLRTTAVRLMGALRSATADRPS